MIRMVITAIAISITLFSCNGQKKDAGITTAGNVPKTNIKVNKEYDKKGNIIKYDSSYSYYYSNIRGDTNLRDSIFDNFKNQFNHRYFFSSQPYFKDLFFEDSLLRYDFYKKDFFYNRFMNNREQMDKLFRGMDSMKNDFFNEQFKNKATSNKK